MSLALALALDAVFGEPRWLWSRLPHPAVLMGRVIDWMDLRYNRDPHRGRRGVFCLFWLCSGAILLGLVVRALPFGAVLEVILAAVLLAQRSLVDHVRAVADALDHSLHEGRQAVAMIVGRDVSAMQDSDVARAAIESAAENFSDGVIAPAFWFCIAGLPGILLYKVVNTADSMIGYRTPRHEKFGAAAARLDDVLNWVPARLTAALIVGLYGIPKAWTAIVRDARKHRSPNAGWPEAAMARVLGVALSGPRSYSGQVRDFPYVNSDGQTQIGASEIRKSVAVLWRCWGVVFLGAALWALLQLQWSGGIPVAL